MRNRLPKTITVFLITIGVILWGSLVLPIPTWAQNQTCTHTVSDTASLFNVQNTIRSEISGGLSRNIVICLNGGTYYLTSPLQFDNRDSGTGQYSITYQSTPGQSAVISGGKIITTLWNKSGNVWINTLSDNVSFRQLYLNNSRLPRASRSFTIASVNGQQITVKETADFSNLSSDAEVLALGIYSSFREKIISGNGNTLTAATLMGIGSVDSHYPYIAPQAGQPLFVENDPQYLDQPAEWTLSTSSKTLKYVPKSAAENPNSEQFIYPYLNQLLIINGSKNLKFNHLTFAHSKWTLPAHGYDGQQAGINTTNPSISYFDLPTILIENASNLEFNSNTFWHLGSHGLALGQGSNYIKIDGNIFTDMGGNAIMIGYRPEFVPEAEWSPLTLTPQHNEVTNNMIYSTANEMWDAVGIFAAFSSFTNISSNLIHDLPYSGISAGLNWSSSPSSMNNTTIQNNLIYHTNSKLRDGGGIYVLGNQSDSFMFNNALTDIYPPNSNTFPIAGIYFDNGSSGWRVQENSTSTWWCSDCQPNHVPTDSPSNFDLISNYIYGDVPPTKYYISPSGQLHAQSGNIITTDSNCYNSLANGDYYFPSPNSQDNRPCQTTANSLSNYFLLQGLADDNRLGQNEKWIYGYQPRSDWAPFGPQITPIPTATSSSCPKKAQGDANCDDQVDSTDYFYYVAAVNGGQVPANVNPDFNGDGEVGLSDRTIIINSLP